MRPDVGRMTQEECASMLLDILAALPDEIAFKKICTALDEDQANDLIEFLREKFPE